MTNQQMHIYKNVLSRVIIKCNIQWFYHSLLYNYLYIDYIIVVRHPDDGHWSDRNMLVENNMWSNILINVRMLLII
jgi:hypothetical protein